MNEAVVIVESRIADAEALWGDAVRHGFRPEMAFSFDAATDVLAKSPLPEALILAFSHCERSRLSFLKTLRAASRTRHLPVFIIAPDAPDAVFEKFTPGLYDHVVLPAALPQLALRLRAVLQQRVAMRRQVPGALAARALPCGLELDEQANRILATGAYAKNSNISLSRTQFRLFKYLASHTGEVLSREAIFSAVWGTSDNARLTLVDSQVHRLRGILRGAGYALLIETILREGYRLVTHL